MYQYTANWNQLKLPFNLILIFCTTIQPIGVGLILAQKMMSRELDCFPHPNISEMLFNLFTSQGGISMLALAQI